MINFWPGVWLQKRSYWKILGYPTYKIRSRNLSFKLLLLWVPFCHQRIVSISCIRRIYRLKGLSLSLWSDSKKFQCNCGQLCYQTNFISNIEDTQIQQEKQKLKTNNWGHRINYQDWEMYTWNQQWSTTNKHR